MSASSPIPDSWARATLGDILLTIEAGKSFRCEARPARRNEWGVIKVSAMTYGDFREEENKAVTPGVSFDIANEVKPGDILFSRANTESYVGASVLVGKCRSRLLLSDKSLRLIPSPSVDRRWLAHLLGSPEIRKEISRRATGTKDSMRNISQASLREIQIRIPPVAEQYRIVAALEGYISNLDTAAQMIISAGNRAKNLWSSVLNSVTTGNSASTSNQIEFKSIAEVAEVQGGIQKQQKRRPLRNAFPFLRVANVSRGGLDLSSVHMVELFGEEIERYRLQGGDLLVVEGNGSSDQIGRAAVWQNEIPDCVHQNHLIRVRPGPELDSRYLEYVWNAPETAQKLRSVASSTSGLFTLNTSKVKSIKIPVPPRSAQEQLVAEAQLWRAHLDSADQSIKSSYRRADSLRRSLLDEAFAGRLVEQDPADEPASVLLERIQAERAAQEQARRSRRRLGEMAPQKEALF
jgi:type I restriction enzyme S subunit